jgi:hypothetical protein
MVQYTLKPREEKMPKLVRIDRHGRPVSVGVWKGRFFIVLTFMCLAIAYFNLTP